MKQLKTAVQEIDLLGNRSEIAVGTLRRTMEAHLSLNLCGFVHLYKIFFHRLRLCFQVQH